VFAPGHFGELPRYLFGAVPGQERRHDAGLLPNSCSAASISSKVSSENRCTSAAACSAGMDARTDRK
jgi:hypothetical protein